MMIVQSAEYIDSDGEPMSPPPRLADERRKTEADEHLESTLEDNHQSSSSLKAKSKGPRSKKVESEPRDKLEEQIKRLKTLVGACGKRVQWKREFKLIDSQSGQIDHLKRMLYDLGMNTKGKMSLAKAKEIGERRALEAEIDELKASSLKVDKEDDDEEEEDEDEDEDEEGMENKGERRSGGRKRKSGMVIGKSDDEEDEDNEKDGKKRINPYAFLGQGSDDESD
ncbi:hypothetical protein BY996DRAFT_3519926 [Phakopsora pachyrhizi]|nr:hypothetical protein BY996DRAFT_3519926 [Phakopsora pachyrhizi]